jgi:hypothetical protein
MAYQASSAFSLFTLGSKALAFPGHTAGANVVMAPMGQAFTGTLAHSEV